MLGCCELCGCGNQHEFPKLYFFKFLSLLWYQRSTFQYILTFASTSRLHRIFDSDRLKFDRIYGIKPQSPLTKSPRQNHPARITPPESPLNLDHPCPKSPLPKITPVTITPGHNHPWPKSPLPTITPDIITPDYNHPCPKSACKHWLGKVKLSEVFLGYFAHTFHILSMVSID